MDKLLVFWSRHVSHHLTTLIAAIGVVGLAACLFMLLGLGWLCEEILEKESFALDAQILLGIHQWATPLLDQVMLTITRLGNPEVVVVVVVLSLGWFLWEQKWAEAKTLAIACLGALILNQGLKLVFTRPRPVLWTQLIKEISYSFPSGHALGSSVLYGFLAYLLAVQFPKCASLIYIVAGVLVTAIGFSRLYLGVHYPTDIIAGYAIGFLWVNVCIVMIKLQTKPRISSE